MQGLLKDGCLFASGHHISYGIWDEPDIEKWAIFDENDNVLLYAIDSEFEVVSFSELPEDYAPGRYIFVDGEFVRDPDYVEPLPPTDIRVEMLEADMEIMSDYSLELLYQISLLQLGMDDTDIEEE